MGVRQRVSLLCRQNVGLIAYIFHQLDCCYLVLTILNVPKINKFNHANKREIVLMISKLTTQKKTLVNIFWIIWVFLISIKLHCIKKKYQYVD